MGDMFATQERANNSGLVREEKRKSSSWNGNKTVLYHCLRLFPGLLVAEKMASENKDGVKHVIEAISL